ncbi:RagB/SusD family nutrient uptake outer membrane protein [Mesonia aquimarina]|uniref:RagB/SusD family nutrient uptake outer membrane protein n=1 Tax=Mesonia aquimarina TaxID=1504967 RepID=UPI000EF5F5CA|nr:RagB/SusD family nutrient uptake outer membrane protein [Mesonia aquimarina]
MKLYKKISLLLFLCFLGSSCEDFVEVEAPDHQLPVAVVFENEETARSAMLGIYYQLFRSAAFSNGHTSSVTALAGLSAGTLTPVDATNTVFTEFLQHEVLPQNPNNFNLWSSAYQTVYMVNSFLEGLEASDSIPEELASQLRGEALFIRGFTYFYLKQLYGKVPLILTSDYRQNASAASNTPEEILTQILTDLQTAESLLSEAYPQQERTTVNRYAVKALLARIALYNENWEAALQYSNEVIAQTSLYGLEENVNDVFLANSQEAIWQISPLGGGNITTNTHEWTIFSSAFPQLRLTAGFETNFETGDLRKTYWLEQHPENNTYRPYKYKTGNTSDVITEYSMVLRLAEQYFIRAEAQAKLGNMSAAIADLDDIRERAGISLIAQTQPNVTVEDFSTLLLEERQRELFAEWGHRWLDLWRTQNAAMEFSGSAFWEPTDERYPIPEDERIKNPNLTQNPGY